MQQQQQEQQQHNHTCYFLIKVSIKKKWQIVNKFYDMVSLAKSISP